MWPQPPHGGTCSTTQAVKVCQGGTHLRWVRRPDLAVRVHEHAQVLVHRDAPARRARKGQRRREVCRACACTHVFASKTLPTYSAKHAQTPHRAHSYPADPHDFLA